MSRLLQRLQDVFSILRISFRYMRETLGLRRLTNDSNAEG